MTSARNSSREAIREAAAALFPVRGYTGTSVRDIAAQAGVDPALVIRHCGSKEELFLEILRFDPEAQPLLDGPIGERGEHFIEYVLTAAEQVRSVFLARSEEHTSEVQSRE